MKKKIEKGSVALKKHTSETEKLKKSYRFHTQKHVGKNRKIDKTLINILKIETRKLFIHQKTRVCFSLKEITYDHFGRYMIDHIVHKTLTSTCWNKPPVSSSFLSFQIFIARTGTSIVEGCMFNI